MAQVHSDECRSRSRCSRAHTAALTGGGPSRRRLEPNTLLRFTGGRFSAVIMAADTLTTEATVGRDPADVYCKSYLAKQSRPSVFDIDFSSGEK